MALSSCDGAAQPSPSLDLSGLLTSAVPAGYVTAPDGAAVMDLQSAAPATLADPARMRSFLSANDFEAGYVHIYAQGAAYIDLLVFQFASAAHSQALVQFEVQELHGALGADVQSEPAIPGAYLFTLFAKTRQGQRPVFCQGTWYALNAFAFEVLTCSSQPGDPSLALDLTSLQYAQDLRSGSARSPGGAGAASPGT